MITRTDYVDLASRGNSNSVVVYTDFEKDDAALEAAEAANDAAKAKKIHDKMAKAWKKQADSIAKLDEKQRKQYEKEYVLNFNGFLNSNSFGAG